MASRRGYQYQYSGCNKLGHSSHVTAHSCIGNHHQFKSDEHLAEARRLLRHARENLEERDRPHAAARLERAIREIDLALKVK